MNPLRALWPIATLFAILTATMISGVIDYEKSQDEKVAPIGQDIGGGIHTTCHGLDRLYLSDHGIAVVHGDTTCDSGG